MVEVATPTLNSEIPAVAVKSNARPPATSVPSKRGGILILLPNIPAWPAHKSSCTNSAGAEGAVSKAHLQASAWLFHNIARTQATRRIDLDQIGRHVIHEQSPTASAVVGSCNLSRVIPSEFCEVPRGRVSHRPGRRGRTIGSCCDQTWRLSFDKGTDLRTI